MVYLAPQLKQELQILQNSLPVDSATELSNEQKSEHNHSDVDERIELWENLVGQIFMTKKTSPIQNKALKKESKQLMKQMKEYEKPFNWLSFIFNVSLFIGWLSLNFIAVMLLITSESVWDAILLWLAIIFMTALSCLTIKEDALDIQSTWKKIKYKQQTNKLAKIKFCINDFTLEDRDIPSQYGGKRKMVYWKEKNCSPISEWKWFNDYNAVSFIDNEPTYMMSLLKCWPELSEILESKVNDYPMNKEQFEFIINDESCLVDDFNIASYNKIPLNAYREFMTDYNQLSTKDLIVLSEAAKLYCQLTEQYIPKETIKAEVKQYLESHFTPMLNDIRYEKSIQPARKVISKICKSLNKIHDFPENIFEEWVTHNPDELKQKYKTIKKIVNELQPMLLNNPQIKLDFNLLEKEHDCLTSLNIDGLITHLQFQKEQIIKQIVETNKMKIVESSNSLPSNDIDDLADGRSIG